MYIYATQRSRVAPIAARIPSSNAGERGPRANAECGNCYDGVDDDDGNFDGNNVSTRYFNTELLIITVCFVP